MLLASASAAEAGKPDYSKEAFVIETYANTIAFAADGTGTREQTAAVRIQSDAGVRQFGLLSFSYLRENERLDLAYVRVRKPDGTLVTTPESDVQEMPSEVARAAPMYTDLREKQVPVKSLGAGDVLEYQVSYQYGGFRFRRYTRIRPEVPNQFWYSQSFVTGAIVLGETLEISMPATVHVKVASASAVKPEIREEAGRRIYRWKTAQLEPASQNEKKAKPPTPSPPSVQLTTFQSWEEVGRWYSKLQQERTTVSPAIQAKADELTRGLATAAEKDRAIYKFVSAKFRYIGISFGTGRFQPHSADDVFSNQYGDCKDKHTLFAALLKAAGIDAWPALIGSGNKLEPAIPSPAQFDHVITVVPLGKDALWLDTTPEVAPFGMLSQPLRDKQALVMPSGGPPSLMRTPADPPFPSYEKFEVKSSLAADGTLTGHFDVTARGDSELVLRILFRQTPAAQWQQFVQNMSYATGFSGTVSKLDVSDPEDTDKPLHYAYDYIRKSYSDWENLRITPPFPTLGFTRGKDDPKPEEPVEIGTPGEIIRLAEIRLPEGYSASIPEGAHAQRGSGDYISTYSINGGVLTVERRLRLKKRRIAPDEWQDYLDLEKAVLEDQDQFIQLARATEPSEQPDVQRLLTQAMQALQKGEMIAAREGLEQAERLNPKQKGLWGAWAALHMFEGQPDKAADALRREITNRPDDPAGYGALAELQTQLGRDDEAIESWRNLLKVSPDNSEAAKRLGELLIRKKRYSEAIDALRPNLNNPALQYVLATAYLRSGKKEEAIALLRKTTEDSRDPNSLNNAAYLLADSGADIATARSFAEKAVAILEDSLKSVTLSDLNSEALSRMRLLEAAWDTLGWVHFRAGDLSKAEKYIYSAWMLRQDGVVGDHLGQIQEKQGKKKAAIHAYQLALAMNPRSMEETRARLAALGGAQSESAAAELSTLRTVDIPKIVKEAANAEFYILFFAGKAADTQFISGSESLRKAGGALLKGRYDISFPDDGPEKIVKRGILSCSSYSPDCHFVFLLHSEMVGRSLPPARD